MLASRCAKFHKNLWQEFCSLLRRGSCWVSHQNKIIERIESARGTMGRGKPRALSFSFSPASPPPTTQGGLCGGEREFWDIVQFLHEGYNLRVNWILDYLSKFANSWKVFPLILLTNFPCTFSNRRRQRRRSRINTDRFPTSREVWGHAPPGFVFGF